MFFPGKEEFIFLEQQIPEQKQIWKDACDIGVVLTDRNREQFRNAIGELMKTFVYKKHECGILNGKASAFYSWHVELFIPIEFDEGMTIGYAVSFVYTKDARKQLLSLMRPGETEWVSIDIKHIGKNEPAEHFIRN